MTPTSFYERDGDRYVSTPLTRGPWGPDAQHVGPPCALLGRQMERCDTDGPREFVRLTFEILRPVPIAALTVEADVVRPGRSVELVEGTLSNADGVLLRARGWRIRTGNVTLPEIAVPPPGTPAPPEAGTDEPFFDVAADIGYHSAMDWRFVSGAFREPGPATVWLKMAVPLVPDEEPSPLVRVLVAADSGNGVSAALDPREHLFINTDLSVHLHRLPVGEWVCLDARSYLEEHGVGVAESELFDTTGRLGRSLQSLLVSAQDRAT